MSKAHEEAVQHARQIASSCIRCNYVAAMADWALVLREALGPFAAIPPHEIRLSDVERARAALSQEPKP